MKYLYQMLHIAQDREFHSYPQTRSSFPSAYSGLDGDIHQILRGSGLVVLRNHPEGTEVLHPRFSLHPREVETNLDIRTKSEK